MFTTHIEGTPTRPWSWITWTGTLPALIASFCIAGLSSACGQTPPPQPREGEVSSHLEGQIKLSTEIDSVADYSDFEILVADRSGGGIDTLAFATTDQAGQFELDVIAPGRNIYSLVLARAGSILRVDDIAIADGDSATINVTFPFGQRPVMIRSKENAALLGFKNTVALHNAEIDRMTQEGVQDREVFANKIYQTSEILWGLQETSTGTLAASLAAAQSIVMLEEWNDSLVVARARSLDPNNVNYANVVGAARRAQVRREGTEVGPAIVEELKAKITDDELLAAAQTELVLAYRDNGQDTIALEAARALKMQYATDSSWIRWADRAIFDLENLRPGMSAPEFNLVDVEGNAVTLGDFAGEYLVLEFYAPGSEFANQLTPRNAFYRADETPPFEILSISLQPDPVMNEAFFEGRDIPGRHVFLEDGVSSPIVEAYNVYLVPTRFLIDPEGNLVGKYVLNNGLTVYQDALVLSQAQ